MALAYYETTTNGLRRPVAQMGAHLMLNHFFISDCDGALHDTRQPNWSAKPLRANYKRHHADIKTTADYKATLRAGGFVWPGGYPLFLICADGGVLCFDCARKEARNVLDAIHCDDRHSGWRVVACDVNYEDQELNCDHCGERIAPAYGDD